MKLLMAVTAAVAALVVAPAGSSSGDTCAVRAQGPRLTPGKIAFLTGEFMNTCRRPMAQMGAYACIEELDWPQAPPRVIDCAATRRLGTKPNALVSVKLRARCDYTTIKRWYRISGYGWAYFTAADGGAPAKSPTQRTPVQAFWMAGTSKSGSERYCHISREDVTWTK